MVNRWHDPDDDQADISMGELKRLEDALKEGLGLVFTPAALEALEFLRAEPGVIDPIVREVRRILTDALQERDRPDEGRH